MSAESDARMPLRAYDPTAVGPYRLSALLGSGGMGTVYLGTDGSGRQAAVKVLRDGYGVAQPSLQRFAREVVAVAAIDSPRVARLLDADPVGERPWLATEYVAGPTLTAAVLAGGPMSAERLRGLAVGMAEGLCAVHEAGVVHRDLKPSNVMLADDGPKIIDFGIVAGLPGTVTESGIVLGSVGYMAPELLIDSGQPSPKVDIFSWALTLVFASSGQAPFGSGSLEALLYRTVHTEPDLRHVPKTLRRVIAGALRKQPRRRPTAQELLTQLQPTRTLTVLGRPVGASPSDTATTDLRDRAAALPAVLDTGDTAQDDQAPGSSATGRTERWRRPSPPAAVPATGTAAREKPWRLLVAVAGGLAGVAVTATALLTGAFTGSPATGAAGAQPPPPTTRPAASSKPAPPGSATAAPAGTDPQRQRPSATAAATPASYPYPAEPAHQQRATAPHPPASDQPSGAGDRQSTHTIAALLPGICADDSQTSPRPFPTDWTRIWCDAPFPGLPPRS